MSARHSALFIIAISCSLPAIATAQHDMSMHAATSSLPTSPGQAAYGAIGEIVRMLEADSTTDWSKVNIEALRRHLIDMDDVMMHASVVQRSTPTGAVLDVTGTGTTAAAIKRIAVNHARMLDEGDEYSASATALPNGARITVSAKGAGDKHTVEKIRGLGFAGLMTEGDHHAPHHLALARGEMNPHGR